MSPGQDLGAEPLGRLALEVEFAEAESAGRIGHVQAGGLGESIDQGVDLPPDGLDEVAVAFQRIEGLEAGRRHLTRLAALGVVDDADRDLGRVEQLLEGVFQAARHLSEGRRRV